MFDAPIRPGLGSYEYGGKSPERTSASQPPAPVSAKTTSSGAVAAQGIGYASYVVAPDTLIQAQETRAVQALRRDDGASTKPAKDQELTDEELERVQELKKIDREVRAHERAHRAAGGTLTGPAQFEYVRGPDGQQYAVSGEVSIDVGHEGSAAATAAKMEAVIRAALAPANPSAQDLAVAAKARQILNEVSQEAQDERQGRQQDEAHAAAGAYAGAQQHDAGTLIQSFNIVA